MIDQHATKPGASERPGEAVEAPETEMPSASMGTLDGAPVVTLRLPDEAGTYHSVLIDEADWLLAHALTPEWKIVKHYESWRVVSTTIAAVCHRHRSYRYMNLSLCDFIMQPAYGDTARHLDGNPLNCLRRNMVTRPKRARTIERPYVERDPTLKEMREDALTHAIFEGRDVPTALADATAAHKQRTADKRAATQARGV